MKKQKITLLSVVVFIVFMSCSKGKDDHAAVKGKGDDCSDVHWSHHPGEDGPENWASLCSGFSDCGGTAQSPIDIKVAEVKADQQLAAPEFSYGSSQVAIVNNGHTVQFNVSGDHSVVLDGKTYRLLQFHYHAASEHTIDGKQYPLEVHFVHKHSDDDFAVLGVFFEEGDEYPLFTNYLDSFPKSEGEHKSSDLIELADLFPANKSYYNYKGSLTTPPCSEVVNWYVLHTPVTASAQQLKRFAEILDNNFRPVLPLNGRTVRSFTE